MATAQKRPHYQRLYRRFTRQRRMAPTMNGAAPMRPVSGRAAFGANGIEFITRA